MSIPNLTDVSDTLAPSSPCPICAAPTQMYFDDVYDDRYGYPGRFSLRRCDRCGHKYVPASFSSSQLGQLYTQYYPRGSFAVEAFAPEIEKTGFRSWLAGDRASAFRWVPRNVRVLDIGCGIGATLAYHRSRGCEAVGIETDENVQAISSRYGLDIRVGVFNADDFAAASFDYVTLDQVAEHVTDPRELFAGIARVLKPGGVAIITTPNANGLGAWLFGRRWLNWHIPYHLQFYTGASIGKLAQRAGLQVIRSATITPSEWQFYQWHHALSFPKEGARSDFWSASEGRRSGRILARLADAAHRWRLHQAISRLLDLFSLGDNRVFLLRKL